MSKFRIVMPVPFAKSLTRVIGLGGMMDEQQRRHDQQRQNAILCAPGGVRSPFHPAYPALNGGINFPIHNGLFGQIHVPHHARRRRLPHHPQFFGARDPRMMAPFMGRRRGFGRRQHIFQDHGRWGHPPRLPLMARHRARNHPLRRSYDFDDDYSDDDESEEDDYFSDSELSDSSYDSTDEGESFFRPDPRRDWLRRQQGLFRGNRHGRDGSNRRLGHRGDPRMGALLGGGIDRVPGFRDRHHRAGRYGGGGFDDMGMMY